MASLHSINLEPLENAINSLEEALSQPSHTKLERDGVIQRFEYTYELCWKAAKRILEAEGIAIDTPRSIFRELGNLGWINNVEAWLAFHKSRNYTSHQYGEKLAEISFSLAKQFLPIVQQLFQTLKVKNKSDV